MATALDTTTRNPRIVHLKIKIKSLADESRLIRQRERKAKLDRDPELLSSLRDHRIHVVRPAARYALLAYAFLRGRTYAATEPRCADGPSIRRLRAEVHRFAPQQAVLDRKGLARGGRGIRCDTARLEQWLDEADA